jgi:hypothetical protein
LSSIPELGLAPDHDLGAVHTLPDFRAILESDPMTPADRETLAAQAEAMIDGLYVHMLQKRAMYGIDPAQRLRLLRRKLPQTTGSSTRSSCGSSPSFATCTPTTSCPRPTRGRSPSWAS